jgi:hypothetical protein
MNPFRHLPHPPKSLKPVKEMLLQELMHLVVVVKLSTAFLNMLDPVETCISDIRRETALNSTALDVGYTYTRSV